MRTWVLGVKTRDPIVHGLWPGLLLCPSDSLIQMGQAAKTVSPQIQLELQKKQTNQNHLSLHPSISPSIYLSRHWGPWEDIYPPHRGAQNLLAQCEPLLHLGGTRVMYIWTSVLESLPVQRHTWKLLSNSPNLDRIKQIHIIWLKFA